MKIKKQLDEKELKKKIEMRRSRNKKILSKLALLLPFLIGVVGYLAINPQQYSDALYFSLRLYGMNFDTEASTLLLEVARWSALVATTSVVLSVLKKLYKRFYIQIILFLRKDLTVIYGDNVQSRFLEEDLKSQKIRCAITDELVNSSRPLTHVIMFEDQEDNLEFFCQNSDRFAPDSKIHIWLEKFEASVLNTQDVRVDIFSIAEIIARKFWIDNFEKMHKLAVEKPVVKIALIGTGVHMEKLLDYAMQLNVFTLDQEIEYHVFGDLKDYQNLHYNLPSEKHENYNKVSLYEKDSIYFYNENWKANARIFQEIDNLIICDSDNNNFETFSELEMYVAKDASKEVCIFSELGKVLNKQLADKNHLFVFGNIQDVLTSEHILHSAITSRAKQINFYYQLCQSQENESKKIKQEKNKADKNEDYKTYGYAELTSDGCWGELSNFHIDSNIFAASYWLTRRSAIKDIEIKVKKEAKAELEKVKVDKPINLEDYEIKDFDMLAELEHIRWSRFHFMHNWVYKNQKDNTRRYHIYLKDYSKLEKETQDKDKVTIIVALEEEKYQNKSFTACVEVKPSDDKE